MRSKYTPEITHKICALIADGNYVKTACEAVGISQECHYNWIKVYDEYSEAIKKAEAASEAWHVNNIKKAASKSWQASAWYLERKFAQRWGRQIVIQTNDTKLDKLLDAFDAEVRRPDAAD